MRRLHLLTIVLLLPRFVHAAEPACGAAGLHVGIVDGRLDPHWCGPAPGITVGAAVDLKSFVQQAEKHLLLVSIAEHAQVGREVSVNVRGASVEVNVRWPAENRQASLTQDEKGVALVLSLKEVYRGRSFHDLIREHTAEVQVNILRVLADLGVTLDPSPDLPVVMALAASGYSDPDPATLETVTKLLAELSGADAAARDKAQAALVRLFPLAIKHLSDLAKNSADPELKTRLEAVIAAHPGIARARAYVEEQGLQNDRKYVEGLVNEVPLFRDAAKMRLAVIAKP